MSVILHPPKTVLFVGDDRRISRIREALCCGEADELQVLDDIEAIRERVATDEEVGCVVAGDSLSADARRDLSEAVRSQTEDLPVVQYADDSDVVILRLALRAGTSKVVDSSAALSELREAVDDALRTYRRRRIEAEESEMLTGLLDSLGKSIYVKDRDLRIIHHADVGGGIDPEQARGKTDLELYDDQESIRQAYEDGMDVIEGNKIIDREERIRENDLWMRTTKVPWKNDDGEIKGLIGHTIDITEYKRQERKLKELRHQYTTFTRQLRHDLKTQIQIAVGLLDGIERGRDGQVARLERTFDQIDQIVEDYHKLARQSVSIGDEITPTDLEETVEAVLSVVDTGDTAVVVDVDPETYVNAPCAMVRTVLDNLLRDATSHVGAEDTVRVGTTNDGFYVEDTSGVVPEFKREIIEHTGYTTTQDGSGRELSIVKDQIEEYIWSLSLDESREGGARIEVQNCLVDAESDLSEESGTRLQLGERTTIGHLERQPTATYDEESNQWSVAADGNDIFRQDNDFFFVQTAVDGPVSIQARVRELEHVSDFSKAGIMIRESLSPDAAYGYIGKTPAFGSELLWRSETGADGESQQLDEQAALFEWYRLNRIGDEVRMSLSMDGQRWQEVGRRQLACDGPVHVGLVVCSTVPDETCEAVFEDVVVRKLDDPAVES